MKHIKKEEHASPARGTSARRPPARQASERTRARTPEAKEELRNLILREATALFVEEGYAGFSMRKLAGRLGYTTTVLYSYFENKRELLLAIIGEGYQRVQTYL